MTNLTKSKHNVKIITLFLGALLFPALAFSSEQTLPSMIGSPFAIVALIIFVLAYLAVMMEEYTALAKSKPVVFAAGIIWLLVAVAAHQHNVDPTALKSALNHNLVEYASLLLFLLVAMTYINVLIERNVFEALRCWLIKKGFSYYQMFWITGFIAFFLSPIADNLTTALLMGTVVVAVGNGSAKFISLSFINIVVASNAGGAFSPFGDITTLMVWQAGKAQFTDFFALFFPALINFIVPAFIMSLALPNDKPESIDVTVKMKRGAVRAMLLFLLTIFSAVAAENFFHLPPYIGMLTGLSYLFLFTYYLNVTSQKRTDKPEFNIFSRVAKAEWDTLLFFYGVIFCVGGLAFLGYLSVASHYFYTGLGASAANIIAGILSAVIDNIPVMFAILTMSPEMDTFQWLLVTLTAGVGGSLLSIGSAAGVALMGQSNAYTFITHLKWSWAIALGYICSIGVHFWLNG